jgi:cytochrome P450
MRQRIRGSARSIGKVRSLASADRARSYPLGAGVTVEQLETEPYALLAELGRREPVSWIGALQAWLVTRRDLALAVMRDPETYTVDDPRFSTAQVVGTSMLSTDGEEHARHRDPFAQPFRLGAVRERLASTVEDEADRLVAELEPRGEAELRRDLAGPLAVVSMAHALGLAVSAKEVLAWYDAIVAAVNEITEGRSPGAGAAGAVGELREAVESAITDERSLVGEAARSGHLSTDGVVSNAAVLLFGGIETTEGMIANAFVHLLGSPQQLALVQADSGLLAGAVEESLRLEPSAAVVDRYAARVVELAGVPIQPGELVRVSLTAANRDPAYFPEPDVFDVRRPNAHQHLAFAQGPHVCLGMHLARIEAQAAVRTALRRLPGLRLDPDRPACVRGLVFRKPQTLNVLWG